MEEATRGCQKEKLKRVISGKENPMRENRWVAGGPAESRASLTSNPEPVRLPGPAVQVRDWARNSCRGLQPCLETKSQFSRTSCLHRIRCQEGREPGPQLKVNQQQRGKALWFCHYLPLHVCIYRHIPTWMARIYSKTGVSHSLISRSQ